MFGDTVETEPPRTEILGNQVEAPGIEPQAKTRTKPWKTSQTVHLVASPLRQVSLSLDCPRMPSLESQIQ